jgi:hypothetical protein
VIIGGVAVVLHGHVRDVADLDLIVDRTPLEADRVMRAIVGAGFFPTIPLPLTQVVVMTAVDARQRRLDLHARELTVPVIALDDLI